MQVKTFLCSSCAETLRRVLAEQGEEALGRAVGEVLCGECRKQIPQHYRRMRFRTELKRVH